MKYEIKKIVKNKVLIHQVKATNISWITTIPSMNIEKRFAE